MIYVDGNTAVYPHGLRDLEVAGGEDGHHSNVCGTGGGGGGGSKIQIAQNRRIQGKHSH